VAAASSTGAAKAGSTPSRRAEASASTRNAAVVHEVPQFGKATWSLVDVAVVLGLLLATLLGKNALLALPAVALMPEAGRAVVRGVVLACFYAVQFGGLAFLAARRGLGLADAFGLGRRDRDSAEDTSALGSAGLVLLLLAGTELVSITYGLAMQAAGWKQPLALSTDLSAVFGGGIAGLVASVVLVALVAPLAEELAFRGVLLPAFGALWGMWPAIAVSAVLYGAYHLNLWLLFPTMVLGVALGWLAWTRRSLWPAIVLHVLYNAVAVAAAFLLTR
jgi:membrane protease YdiL (CAAX protease family)